MKKLFLALAVLFVSSFAGAQNFNGNLFGIQWSSGISVPASCAPDGSFFFKNVAPKDWYKCISGSYVSMGGGSTTNSSEFDNGTCTTSKTIDPANGNRQKITLTNADTCALTFTNPSVGTADVRLKIFQSAAGSFNGGISGGKWPAAVTPTITQTSGAIDIISCYLDGTSAFCVPSQDFR